MWVLGWTNHDFGIRGFGYVLRAALSHSVTFVGFEVVVRVAAIGASP